MQKYRQNVSYDALNQVTRHTYNANHQVTSVTLPTGLVVTNIYGPDGFVATNYSYAVFGGSTVYFGTNSYTYSDDLVYTHTDARGLTVTNYYDLLQRLTNIAYPDGTSISYIYSNLDLVKVVDRMGFASSYLYDSMREKIAETNALGAVTRYSYCTCGALDSIEDAASNFTHFFYDNAGRLTNVIYPDLYSLTNIYDLLGRATNVVDSSGASNHQLVQQPGPVGGRQ